MKLENTKKSFIRSVKPGTKENHLNISIPILLDERLQLTNNDYPKIYFDEINNLVFEKLERLDYQNVLL
jgi:hypothetical protein